MKKSQIYIRRTMLFSFSILLLTTAFLTARAAGEVDPTFNAAIQNSVQGTVLAIVTQPDGKVLVGGNFTVVGNTARSNIVRFNTDNTIDQTFVPTDFYKDFTTLLPSKNVVINAIAVQSDGKLLVGGNFTRVGDVARISLVRLNADGSLDASLNVPFQVNFGNESTFPNIFEIKVQPDNKILLGGFYQINQSTLSRNNFTRLNNDGTVDTTFASINPSGEVRAIAVQPDGKILYAANSTLRRLTSSGVTDNSFLDSTLSAVNAITLQPDGKILVGGNFSTTNNSQRNIVRLNTNGAFDPNFNVGGIGTDSTVNDVTVLTDGKIIIGGNFNSYNSLTRQKSARLNADGTPDTSFSYNLGNNILVFAVAATSDGGFIIGGNGNTAAGQPWEKLARFNANGSLDTTFTSGVYQTGTVYQVAAQPDGKILAGGVFQKVNGILRQNIVRLNTGGDVDTTFTGNVTGRIATLVLQPDGKILIGGEVTQVNGTAKMSVARLNTDGTLDTGFSTALQSISIIEKMLVLADGKILIAGYFRLTGYNFILNVARLNPNGSTDTTFSQMPVNAPNFARTIKVQPDGKIVVGGGFTQIAGANRTRIARLNADGTLDESFSPPGGADADVYDLAIQSNGRIVIGGDFLNVNTVANKNRLARLMPDGTLDTSFNPSFNASVYAVERQADDKILVGGRFTPYNGGIERARIARLQADGTVDNTFGGTGANEAVRSIFTQFDGKIIIGGEFSRVNGASNVGVARLLNASVIRTPFDYDGDGKADVSVFRPSTGVWYTSINPAINYGAIQFGISTDRLVPADYDGDGKTDVAVYRDGRWYLQRSQAGFTDLPFGVATDVPVPADYDGDGKADLAVFRPSNNTWYLQQSTAGYVVIVFGVGTDKPVPADYDGDGKANVAVFRPSNGTWYTSTNPAINYGAVQFGEANDKPVPADYDGDGKADVAVFRPANGAWYLNRSRDGFVGISFGLNGDAPVAADYDGDGKADIAVFRNGNWYLNRSTQGFANVAFGVSGDQPTPTAFVR